MTRDEKENFLNLIIEAVRADIISRVAEMPEEWDGHELRRYIADKFERENGLLAQGQVRSNRATKRLAAYRNIVATRNL